MGREHLEQFLRESLSDLKLDQAERRDLRALASDLLSDEEDHNWVRNRAFELVHERANADNYPELLHWLERVLRIARMDDGARAPTQIAMSPGETCRAMIVRAVDSSRHSVDVCVFTITDNEISDRILVAHDRGVRIRVVTDNDKAGDRGSDIERLVLAGVALCADESDAHMHHKFAIFDGVRVLTGSYNWTRSAARANQENLVLMEERAVVRAFQAEFDRLWSRWFG